MQRCVHSSLLAFCWNHRSQFDFSSYCTRQLTLRTYVGLLLRLEDVLRSRPFYFSAALFKCIYQHLHDHPLQDEPSKEELQAGKRLYSALLHLSETALKHKRARERREVVTPPTASPLSSRLRGTSDNPLWISAHVMAENVVAALSPISRDRLFAYILAWNHEKWSRHTES